MKNSARYYKKYILVFIYRGADKSLAQPGRKQATATEDLGFICPIYKYNWRKSGNIYIYIYIKQD